MKKIIFVMMALISAVCVNAQRAVETSKFFDNMSVGVFGGVTTPMDMNSIFPVNSHAGLRIEKYVTPTLGIQVEGMAILNDNHFTDLATVVKATNVGVNGVINWSNVLLGYNPHIFEVSSVTGLGWLHTWDTQYNYLTAKTGLDLTFNLTKNKVHSIVVSPAVYWNLNKNNHIEFNKTNAQLGVSVGYVYHFKNKNNTRYFQVYDIAAYEAELAKYTNKINELEAREPVVLEKVNTKMVTETVPVSDMWVIQFAQNSAELTLESLNILNSIPNTVVVDIVGYASPEGTAEYNNHLSHLRAMAVTDYLVGRGIKVNSNVGRGVYHGDSTNRLVIIKVVK